jgi:hypothetical protein
MLHRGLHVFSFKKYCVTFSDWTPLKLFWTLDGAKKCYRKHREYSNVYHWENGKWEWMCGANDRSPKFIDYYRPDRLAARANEA